MLVTKQEESQLTLEPTYHTLPGDDVMFCHYLRGKGGQVGSVN